MTTDGKEQEVERRLKKFAEAELSQAYREFLQQDAMCPPLSLVPTAASDGWPPSSRTHVLGGCRQCRKRIALQWNIVAPSLRSIIRHSIDGTLPEEQQILSCVQDTDRASGILKTVHFLAPLLATARKTASLIASSHPALALSGGAVFAGAGDENSVMADIHYIHEGLRWTAPVEADKQYLYVEATNPVSVSVLVGGSSAKDHGYAEPNIKQVDLLPLTLRGTQFVWRASCLLGDVSELTGIYGKDYEVIVVVTPNEK